MDSKRSLQNNNSSATFSLHNIESKITYSTDMNIIHLIEEESEDPVTIASKFYTNKRPKSAIQILMRASQIETDNYSLCLKDRLH